MAKVTPTLVRKMRALRAEGLPYAAIAERTGVSPASVSNSLAGRPPAPKKPAKKIKPAKVSSAPMDIEEIRSVLSQTARGLAADAKAYRGNGEEARALAYARQLQGVIGALAKLPPPEGERIEGAVLVSDDSIKAAAERARKRLFKTHAEESKAR